MGIDINKIDERIKKLQELRRIAADSEMTQLLSEFLVSESRPGNNAAAASTMTAPAAAAAPATPAVLPHGDEVSDFVKGVLEGKESSQRGSALPTWNTRKA